MARNDGGGKRAVIRAYHTIEGMGDYNSFLDRVDEKWRKLDAGRQLARIFRDQHIVSVLSDSSSSWLTGGGDASLPVGKAEELQRKIDREADLDGFREALEPVTFTLVNTIGKSVRGNAGGKPRTVAVQAGRDDNGAGLLIRENELAAGTLYKASGGKAGGFYSDYLPQIPIGQIPASLVDSGHLDEYTEAVREVLPVTLRLGELVVDVERV